MRLPRGLAQFPTLHSYGATGGHPVADKSYPEIAWLGRSTYCNPYFGFRLALPRDLKAEPMHLPVQPSGRHMLLALHLQHLDRSADLFLSAFQDGAEDSARRAAKSRIQQARSAGLSASGPHKLNQHQRTFFRIHILSRTGDPGDESSYYFTQRGYVLHAAVFSEDETLDAAVGSAIERLRFFGPAPSACMPTAAPAASVSAYPPSMAAPASVTASAAPPGVPAALSPLMQRRVCIRPALPTQLVESLLREQPKTPCLAANSPAESFLIPHSDFVSPSHRTGIRCRSMSPIGLPNSCAIPPWTMKLPTVAALSSELAPESSLPLPIRKPS